MYNSGWQLSWPTVFKHKMIGKDILLGEEYSSSQGKDTTTLIKVLKQTIILPAWDATSLLTLSRLYITTCLLAPLADREGIKPYIYILCTRC